MYSLKRKNIARLYKKKKELSNREYHFLYRDAFCTNSEIRSAVAELLCDHYTFVAEIILYLLTYDWNWCVRINAIDSLGIGKSKISYFRLKRLTTKKDELIRAYAHMSYNDVIMTRNNYKEIHQYYNWISLKMRQEKSIVVRLMLESMLYIQGKQEYLLDIFKIVKEEIKNGRTRNFWLCMNILEQILNEENVEVIKKLVKQWGRLTTGEQTIRLKCIEQKVDMLEQKEIL